jgi:hypothetical protein
LSVEEWHIVDLETRELVAHAPEVLKRLDPCCYSAELQTSPSGLDDG